jgi:hypothetical protein
MELVITRDSVASGDDADAPHERRLDVPASADVAALVAPAGGRDGRIVAVLAQQWNAPQYVVAPDEPFGADRLHFGYLTQRDPDTVLAECRRGEEPRRRD